MENGRYSKTIQFYDINYQLAQNEDKTLIFENYCDFLNYFDSSIQFQLSFLNQSIDISEYQKSIEIPEQQDDFNGIHKEYVAMLKNQLSKGNNGLIKTKYITFSIEAGTLKAAKPRLERIEADILSNFKVLGVKAQPLNGKERLHVLHSLFHAQDEQKFIFHWKDIVETGMTTKDFIAPDSFNFQYKNKFQIGKTYGAVSFLHITASELTDRMLADFLDLDSNIVVSIHIQSVDQAIAIKRIKRKLSDINKMKLEEQKKAVRSGYDMDILSPDIVTYSEQAQSLLEDLQNRNERMFLVTVLVMNTAETKQKLSTDLLQAQGDRQILAKQLNISPHQLSYVTNTNAGEEFIFYGNVIIPFVDHFPKDTELYSIMTTKLEDLAQHDRKISQYSRVIIINKSLLQYRLIVKIYKSVPINIFLFPIC